LSILILNKPKKLEEILRADYLIKKLLTVFILIIKKSFNQTLIYLLHLFFLIQVEIKIFLKKKKKQILIINKCLYKF
jgi:hypothetical protein